VNIHERPYVVNTIYFIPVYRVYKYKYVLKKILATIIPVHRAFIYKREKCLYTNSSHNNYESTWRECIKREYGYIVSAFEKKMSVYKHQPR
jgi:hypothetical protein